MYLMNVKHRLLLRPHDKDLNENRCTTNNEQDLWSSNSTQAAATTMSKRQMGRKEGKLSRQKVCGD